MHISKSIRATTVLCALSLIILLLIPRDPKNIRFLGFSTSRLIMISGFISIMILLIAVLYIFNRNPEYEIKLSQRIQNISLRTWARELVLFIAALIILIGLFFLIEFIITSDVQRKQILLRLTPFMFFVMGVSWQILSYGSFKDYRKKWLIVICLTALATTIGGILQVILLGQLDRPYSLDADVIKLSQLCTALISFIFFSKLLGEKKMDRAVWILLLTLISILFILQWNFHPQKYWRSKHYFALLIPITIFSIAFLTMIVFDLWGRLHIDMQRKFKVTAQIGVVFVIVLLSLLYYDASTQHSKILNYATNFTDQAEYLLFAKNARLLNFNYTGDHNRMPGYPFLQALFYHSGMSDSEFFEQGKQINILLSLILLLFMFLIFLRYISKFDSWLLILIIAFSLFIFKAPYFQAEILYYFLAFLAFLLMLKMLIRPDLWLAITTGIIIGLAHLTKASILPGLIIFAFVFATKETVSVIQEKRHNKLDTQRFRKTLISFSYLLVVLIFFITTIFPYIQTMKIRFGHYFYNVNLTFYIWYDDLFQAYEAEAEHHFAEKWPSHLPEDEIPGPRKYFREHSLAQIADRFWLGMGEQLNNIKSQFSVTNYHLSFLVILILVFIADIKNGLKLSRRYPYIIGFSVVYFSVYVIAFAWYSPVAPERRFIYGLYIPFMFTLFMAIKELVQNQPKSNQEASAIDLIKFVNASYFVISLSLIINIWLVLTERMFFDRYGA